MNPGPTHLEPAGVSEAELRRQIDAVLQLRAAMDRAVATTDPVERSGRFATLFRSGNTIARHSALQKLERNDEALAAYEKAIALRPDYANAFQNRATAQKALDKSATNR